MIRLRPSLWIRLGILATAGMVAAAAVAVEVPPEAETFIAAARAHLGSEAALERVDSLRYEGTIEFFNTAQRGRVQILLQKPAYQRIEIELPERTRVVAVEELQGWTMTVDRRGETPVRRVDYLPAREYWRNHFLALENLWFHRGYERGRGTVSWEGESVFEGRLVGKLTVRYDAENVFVRRFEKKSGALVVSVGNDGTEVREREWIEIEGVRFPRVLEYYTEGKRSSRIAFDRIEVNPKIDPALFRYPVF